MARAPHQVSKRTHLLRETDFVCSSPLLSLSLPVTLSSLTGRYSIHFHLAGQVPESYVRSNSIHSAFQRACTVHGSHYARVQNNVAAFIKGHSIFVEDGNEKYNVIEGNLVAHTTRLTSMLRSDTKPASFWASSPGQCHHDGVGGVAV